jgi:hypothetical protein
MIDALLPSKGDFSEVILGDKIIKTTQFSITIPNQGLFYGLKHLDIIEKVIFIFHNFKRIYRIEGEMVDDVWKISPYLLPLSKLIEYSNDLKLEIEIVVNNNKKNRFYTFYALFDNKLSPSDREKISQAMYLSVPTVRANFSIEYIGNIWRIRENDDS